MSLTIRARALMTIGLIIVVDGTNFFKPTHFQWSKGLYPSTGPLDYQHGLSLEDCVSLCWEEDGCKSLNYHRHATLCELNRVDIASSLPTDLKDDTMSIYSEKISWTEEEVLSLCLRRKRLPGPANVCMENTQSSYCPDAMFIAETEVVLGNLRKVGNNIRYACIVSQPASSPGKLPIIFPVGVSTCQENQTWSQTWRPCRETGKNYALDRPAYQSTIEGGRGASLAVNGYRETLDPNTGYFVCSHTQFSNIDEWWYVDLGEDVVVAEIVVYLRTDPGQTLYERFQQITFKVAKTQAEVDGDTGAFCDFFEGPITDPDTENPVRIYCPIPKVGRFVRVSASVDTLEMCELEVYTKRNAT